MITPLPRPAAAERPGLVIVDAPGLFHGWQRRCTSCRCSVSADHVPSSPECEESRDERNASQSDD